MANTLSVQQIFFVLGHMEEDSVTPAAASPEIAASPSDITVLVQRLFCSTLLTALTVKMWLNFSKTSFSKKP